MTLRQRILVIFFALIIQKEFVFAAERIKYTITYQHQCLDSDSLINFLLKLSLQQCVQECSLRPICLSINYRRNKLLCELYSEDNGTFIENSLVTGPCVFVKKTSFDPQTPEVCQACSGWETCDPDLSVAPCAIKECPTLSLPSGNLHGNLQKIGSKVKFSCNENYLEVESMTYSICEASGQWSYVPRCITASCSDISQYESMLNVAKGKNTTLSSVFSNFLDQLHVGHLMVDGGISQDVLTCAHTNEGDLQNEATIDLGETYTIYAMRIYNRVDSNNCCLTWLTGVRIRIGDSLNDMHLHVHYLGSIETVCGFVTVQPCRGRYISITKEDPNPLAICEFQVFGEATNISSG